MKTRTAAIMAAAAVLASSGTFGRDGAVRWSRGPANRAPVLPSYQGRVYIVPNRHTPIYAQAPVTTRILPSEPVQHHFWFFHTVPKRPLPSAPDAGSGPFTRLAAPTGPPARFQAPARFQNGRAISAKPLKDMSRGAPMVRQTIANADFRDAVLSLTDSESDHDGKFHWYNHGGTRFSHWYDADRGRDWFGFYNGGAYYWTVSWHDKFWWQEPNTGRWLVFWRDQWWWHGPDGAVYVYIGDQFYRWNPNATGATLVPAPAQFAPAPTPVERTPSNAETLVVSKHPEFNYSADGTRMVQVEGERLSGYLYDTTRLDASGGSRFIKELGEGVTAVAFSDTSGGEPLRITLSVQSEDGTINDVVLDADGNVVERRRDGARPAATPLPAPARARTPIVYGLKGEPGFDAPASDIPPRDAPYPDGN